MQRPIFAAVVLAAALIPVASLPAQVGAKKPADPRVEKLLDDADLKYEIDKDGDFRLLNSLENGRTQVVFINSKTVKLGDLEIREVWAAAHQADALPAKALRRLLEQNDAVKLGAWRVVTVNDRETAVFAAQVAAETDVSSILLALNAVSETADEMEKELNGGDEF